MAELRTEEEQVEALKSWWKENGKSLIMGVVIAVAAVFGWRGWNQYQDDFAANASAMYESILNPVANHPKQPKIVCLKRCVPSNISG